MLRTQVLSTLAIAGFILSPSTYADDPPAETPEPLTPEAQHLKDVQADAALAKAKLEIAQSEIDLLKLKVGAIDTTNLPKGGATVTDMDLEGKLRAYAATKKSADLIAEQVLKVLPANTRVVLATDSQLQALNQYRSFLVQVEELNTRTEKILKEAAPSLKDVCAPGKKSFAAAGVAVVAVNSMLSFAALFKHDVTLVGKAVTLNEFAVATLILQSLREKKVDVVYPATFYVLPPVDSDGEPMQQWRALRDLQDKLRLAAKTYGDQYDGLVKKPPIATEECKKAVAALKPRVDEYLAGFAAGEKAIDEIGAALTKQDAQSGLTLLSAYLVSERVEAALSKPEVDAKGAPVLDAKGKQKLTPAAVLQVKPIEAGGSTQTRKNWFSTKISYGGGSILSYQLFAQDGTLLAVDTIPWYAGFIEAEKFLPGKVELK